jgi:hypothetical protein
MQWIKFELQSTVRKSNAAQPVFPAEYSGVSGAPNASVERTGGALNRLS